MDLKKSRLLSITLAILLASTACSSGVDQQNTGETNVPQSSAPIQTASNDASQPQTAQPVRAFMGAEFDATQATAKGTAFIDVSSVSEGYVAVSAISEKRLKFQVIFGESTYNYDIAGDGTPSIFPLQCGSGDYRFRIMQNISDKKYAELHSTACNVQLEDEFQPFLRPNDYVNYTQDSACVKKAAELMQGMGTDLDKIKSVYDFICKTVKYDKQKAQTVQSGYLPDPDETMATGKGICFDYASLAAAMLRSQGIPTRVIFGYVSPDGLYHAWNMFFTEESGWVTVSYQVSPNDWTRMDLTFSANGADGRFIGDGTNYKDVYMY